MNYEIRKNEQFGSYEVYFDGKPSENVRDALKAMRFRWNGKKVCWYGFADQNAIISAIGDNEPEQLGGVASDGYFGATRWDGFKSDKHLYGAELSAAIRAEIKAAGIKGASVSCKTFSGGQEVVVKVKAQESDYISFEEFYKGFSYNDLPLWITVDGRSVFHEEFITMCDGDGYEKYMPVAARQVYDSERGEIDINYYHISKYKAFSDSMRDKLSMINKILDTFHYDDSNSMVDYFDTNFYRCITIKHEAA